jgi:hypothetical protein
VCVVRVNYVGPDIYRLNLNIGVQTLGGPKGECGKGGGSNRGGERETGYMKNRKKEEKTEINIGGSLKWKATRDYFFVRSMTARVIFF